MSPCAWRTSSISLTSRVPHQRCGSRFGSRSASRSRESIGPFRSRSRNTYRRKRAFACRKSRTHALAVARRRRMRARTSARSSIGQMNASHSKSFRSFHISRSSSTTSNAPSRLKSTRCCGGATVEIGSICRKPRRRTTSSTSFALPSSACACTAMRRALARLAVTELIEFVPSRGALVPEGCGWDPCETIRMPEAPIRMSKNGLVVDGEGWFIVNSRESRWRDEGPLGSYCTFEGKRRFPHFGINISVLEPGERMGMYHREHGQEALLVLAGECTLIVEGEERRLTAWDFF